MKILLDECVPVQVAVAFPNNDAIRPLFPRGGD